MAVNSLKRQVIVDTFDKVTRRLGPPWIFYLVIVLVVLSLSLAFASTSELLGEPLGGAKQFGDNLRTGRGGVAIFTAIALAPLLETLVLWAISGLILIWSRNSDMAILVAIAIVVVGHRTEGVFAAMAIAWPFLVWSAILWSKRFASRTHSFFAVCGLHAAHNAFVIVIGLLSEMAKR